MDVTIDWLSKSNNRKQLRTLLAEIIHTQAAVYDSSQDTLDGGAEDSADEEEQPSEGDSADESEEGGAESEPGSSATRSAAMDTEIPQTVFADPRNGYMLGFRMDYEIFKQIIRHAQKRYKGYAVYYEFDSGYLCVRTVPSQTHEMVTEFIKEDFLEWANSSTARGQAKPMIPLGNAGNVLVICSAANDQDYNWGIRATSRGSKRPDASFRPRLLTSPPGKWQIRMPNQQHYPTISFEVAFRNETWARLVDDARRKCFHSVTSIRIFVGIKIWGNYFQCFWARRSRRGRGMRMAQRTTKLPLNIATQIVFTIPAADTWWGIPNNNLPQTLTPNYDLSLEWLRVRINESL
jgi:hypothetical protein